MGFGCFDRQRFITGSNGPTCQQVQTMKGKHRLPIQLCWGRIID
jgi:Zn ribbon nucleic-acid-binding protein